jgi:hypothetical protein
VYGITQALISALLRSCMAIVRLPVPILPFLHRFGAASKLCHSCHRTVPSYRAANSCALLYMFNTLAARYMYSMQTPTDAAACRLPTTCLFSTALVPRPHDWGSNVTLAGFLSLNDAVTRFRSTAAGNSNTAADDSGSSSSSSGSDSDGDSWASQLSDEKPNSSSSSDWQPSEELLQFLDVGSAPIYIGFGSMVVADPQQLLQLVLQAAAALPAGQRVILCTGWSGAAGTAADAAGGSSSSSSSSRVLCISEAPHEWLFPR